MSVNVNAVLLCVFLPALVGLVVIGFVLLRGYPHHNGQAGPPP